MRRSPRRCGGCCTIPTFQTTEALWRSLDLLVRNLETGSSLKVVIYDMTAEELAADLSSTESLEETGLYKLLVEKPAQDAQQGPLSAIVANFTFEKTPPHAELLGRIAKIAAAAKAPLIANMSADVLEKRKPGEAEHPLVTESWQGLKVPARCRVHRPHRAAVHAPQSRTARRPIRSTASPSRSSRRSTA